MKQLALVSSSVVCCLLLITSNLFASIVNGSISGAFINAIGPQNMVTSGAGTDTFLWGDGSRPGNDASWMNFSGKNFSTETNKVFTFGTLTYFNGTVYHGTESTGVDFRVSLDLSSPAGISSDFTYNLELINTPNKSDPNESADYVVFPGTMPESYFSVNDTDYTMQFLGFGNLSGNAFQTLDGFHILENTTATAELLGVITEYTPQQTPVPGAVWLLGSCLLCATGLRGRFFYK